MRRRTQKNEGFTLVEIMIVVLIIGILLSIAVPVWNSRRREARWSVIVADLKAIEAAKSRFVMDKNKDSSYVVTQADLYPEFLSKWPRGPLNDPSDYIPNDATSRATYRGKSLDDLYDNKEATLSALGL
jgi:prepilin-type N-terminal cleavage/methylation domain-containing protein